MDRIKVFNKAIQELKWSAAYETARELQIIMESDNGVGQEKARILAEIWCALDELDEKLGEYSDVVANEWGDDADLSESLDTMQKRDVGAMKAEIEALQSYISDRYNV